MGRTTTNLEWCYSRMDLYVTELPEVKTARVTSDQYFVAWYVAKVFGLHIPVGHWLLIIGLYLFVHSIYEYAMLPTISYGPLFAGLFAKPMYNFILESILKPVFVTCPLVA